MFNAAGMDKLRAKGLRLSGFMIEQLEQKFGGNWLLNPPARPLPFLISPMLFRFLGSCPWLEKTSWFFMSYCLSGSSCFGDFIGFVFLATLPWWLALLLMRALAFGGFKSEAPFYWITEKYSFYTSFRSYCVSYYSFYCWCCCGRWFRIYESWYEEKFGELEKPVWSLTFWLYCIRLFC